MIHVAMLLLSLTTAGHADSVLKRGKPVPAGPSTTIGAVLTDPAKYADESSVIIDGMVIRSCTSMGCWMQLADGPDAKGVRVDFHDSGFVIPVGAAGMKARAMGKITVTVLTEEDAKHLADEGARVEKNDKGQPIEVGMEATGVELYYVD